MLKRTHKVALMAVLTVVMVLAFAGVALAQWTDMSLSVVGPYGITEAQVGQISQGFVDGSWRPYNDMPRNQFVKMAVDAYKIPLVSPATPTYTDVPKTDYFYAYIEGATAAGLTNGVGGGKFEPNATITREQAAAIIVRWVAAKNGYDLATYYTDAEAAAIVAAFPDAAQVGPTLVKEVAFAIDFGIIWGTNTGTLAPKGTLTRIQGAAMLIRSWGVIPFEPPVNPPAKIELVGADKSENLIGLAHTVTFKVTDAAGAPVAGALVDFDTLMAGYYYVGNISPSSGLTDAAGEAKCILLSTEPGTERMSATVMTPAGPTTVLATKYWVVLDEVYILDKTREAQNNVGTTHEWEARVVVFGPGPLSTSAQDWYNAVSLTADPSALVHNELDGVDWPVGWVVALLNQYYQNLLPVPGSDDWADFFAQGADVVDAWIEAHADLIMDTVTSGPWDFATLINSWLSIDRWSWNTEQLMLGHGYEPRTLAGVPVTWTIMPVSTTVPSVGTISAVEFTGTIAADAKSAVGFTNADGLTSIAIDSTTTGQTYVQAVADYAGNPYPEKLFNHLTSQIQLHFLDWDDQPLPQATAMKTWIPHVIGDTTSPISPALTYANLGEEQLLTITLKDSYGNPIVGRQVEWFMQGIGFFVTDDGNEITDPWDPNGNKDMDVTDAAGQARVLVKSTDPGEQIVHAKVRDKGTGGNEGSFITYDAEVQWFDVDVVTFDDPETDGLSAPGGLDKQEVNFMYPYKWLPVANEALSENTVGTEHTFTLHVYGLKYELDPSVDVPNQQTVLIDTDVTGAAYDGVIDERDAKYFGPKAILLVNCNQSPEDVAPGYLEGDMPFDANGNGVIDDRIAERGTATYLVQGRTITLTGVGGICRYDWDDDGYLEAFDGYTGIYLPLEGKTATFAKANEYDALLSNLGEYFDGIDVLGVGSFTPATAITDANGQATVVVTSSVKGPETIEATVDWEGNPHEDLELVQAYAKKLWIASTDIKIVVIEDGTEIATKAAGQTVVKTIPWLDAFGAPNSTHYEVHVYDSFGNDLPDYEVVYLLEDLAYLQEGNQFAGDTWRPTVYLADLDPEDLGANPYDEEADDVPYDTNGTAPDADEPTPESDPYAIIVGDGGTPAFYFNQWLGAGIPGAANEIKNVFEGVGVYIDAVSVMDVPGYVQFPLNWDKDMAFADYEIHDVGLVTDGAKAWTLDGYFMPDWALEDEVVPNLHTGSHIDVQMAEEYPYVYADDYLTILHIMVYAPADGLVVGQEQQLLWSYQIHQLWEEIERVPTTITLEQSVDEGDTWTAADLLIPVPADVLVRALVLDQFGDIMPNADFTTWAPKLLADTDIPGGDILYDVLDYYALQGWTPETDADGYIYGQFYVTVPQTVLVQGWITWDDEQIYTNDILDQFVETPNAG